MEVLGNNYDKTIGVSSTPLMRLFRLLYRIAYYSQAFDNRADIRSLAIHTGTSIIEGIFCERVKQQAKRYDHVKWWRYNGYYPDDSDSMD